MTMLFEVCLQSVEGAVVAAAAGAHRVELCAALAVGGITPSLATIQACRDAVDVDVMVMIRPRGGDFDYSERELAVMHADIEACKKIGVTGVVFGVLTPAGDLARPQVQSLMGTAGDLAVTFHRAFDVCREPFTVLDQLAELGVSRILTSGQAVTAPVGRDLIRDLITHAAGHIGILPGCGLTPDNLSDFLTYTGAQEFHATAFGRVVSRMRHRNEAVYMGVPGLPEYERWETDGAEVRRFLRSAGI